MAISYLTFLFIVMNCLFINLTGTSTVQLTSGNINDILQHNEVVFVNFYADWCRFSQMLGPIFDETATKLQKDYPHQGKVVLGKVDCDREGGIAAQYHVSKYPTLKVFRYGQLVKREYRGQRSADALANFVKEQLQENLQMVNNMEELDLLDDHPSTKDKRHMIGYFDTTESEDWINFSRIASMLRDDCSFYAAVGPVSEGVRETGNKIIYRPPTVGSAGDESYLGPINDYNTLAKWASDKCIPLVRVITFENAEELTEEGLPFLIMFHNPSDKETPERFKNMVVKELLPEKSSINFLTADGLKFSHPLFHLGKSTSDLPVLAIDSFRHMYIWPHNIETDLETPGLLKQFIADLHSGKLHREFHHGPDKTPAVGGATDDSSNALQVAAGGDHPPGTHYDIQQQVIVHNSGIQVRIMRVLHQGPHDGVKLPEKLALAEKELENAEDKNKDKNEEEKEEQDENAEYEKENTQREILDGDSFKNKIEEHVKRTAQETGYVEPNDSKPQDVIAAQQQQKQQTGHKPDGSNDGYVVVESKSTKLKIQTDGLPESTKKTKSPPESIFKNLAPSKDRYTVLNDRDEL